MKRLPALILLALSGLLAAGQEGAAAAVEPAAPAAAAEAAPWSLAAVHPMMGVVLIPSPKLYTDAAGSTLASETSIVTNTLGAALSLRVSPRFSVEPSLEFYTAYHLWRSSLFTPDGQGMDPRALPTDNSGRTSYTLGLILDIPAAWRFPLGKNLSLALGAGPAFHLRIGFAGAADSPDADLAAINRFFWSSGRFFLPSTFLRGEYKLTELIEFGFAARALWPVFNLWSGSSLLLDEGIFGGTLVVRWRLG